MLKTELRKATCKANMPYLLYYYSYPRKGFFDCQKKPIIYGYLVFQLLKVIHLPKSIEVTFCQSPHRDNGKVAMRNKMEYQKIKKATQKTLQLTFLVLG